jgi:hypothetical protein
MAVGVGADNHQRDLRIVKHLIEIAGEMDMGILRDCSSGFARRR